jgi:hypothetical protein
LEVLQLIENRNISSRPELFPSAWNNGMMEYCNIGLKRGIDIYYLSAPISRGTLPTTQYTIFPKPIIPSFQYSTIPIARPGGLSAQRLVDELKSSRSRPRLEHILKKIGGFVD